VAGDANLAGQMYPDQSLYPSDSVPSVVRRIGNALRRADQIHHSEGNHEIDWFIPIVADAESGFGGALNCFDQRIYITGQSNEDALAPRGSEAARADARRDRGERPGQSKREERRGGSKRQRAG
jgi:hypothetical protein